MEDDKTINVCYCGNDRMFDGILISVLSIAMTTKRPINVRILSGDMRVRGKDMHKFTPEEAAFIEKAARKHNPETVVRAIDVRPQFEKAFKYCINSRSSYTPYAYMRLILDILPDTPSKMIYLDTDIVVVKDLGLLFDIDMTGHDVAMALDEAGHRYISKTYCNSGVLLLNMDEIKKRGTFVKCRKMVNNLVMIMPDQTSLNRISKKSRIVLPKKFNSQFFLLEDTVIRHYCGNFYMWPFPHEIRVRPWQVEAFRKRFGEDTHKELLDEYQELKKEYEKAQ
jgi:lipopolysaccharide biosynthesis glycosyltransferase